MTGERLRLFYSDVNAVERSKYLFPEDARTARAAFCLTVFPLTLDREILNRRPEPSGLRFWSGRLAAHVSSRTVAGAIWRSSEHRALVHQSLAPSIDLRNSEAPGSPRRVTATPSCARRPSPCSPLTARPTPSWRLRPATAP